MCLVLYTLTRSSYSPLTAISSPFNSDLFISVRWQANEDCHLISHNSYSAAPDHVGSHKTMKGQSSLENTMFHVAPNLYTEHNFQIFLALTSKSFSLSLTLSQAHIAISHDGHSVAVASGKTIEFFSAATGDLLKRIEHAHSKGKKMRARTHPFSLSCSDILPFSCARYRHVSLALCQTCLLKLTATASFEAYCFRVSILFRLVDSIVTGIAFEPESRLLASAGTDRQIRLWYNGPGFSERVRVMLEQCDENQSH